MAANLTQAEAMLEIFIMSDMTNDGIKLLYTREELFNIVSAAGAHKRTDMNKAALIRSIRKFCSC